MPLAEDPELRRRLAREVEEVRMAARGGSRRSSVLGVAMALVALSAGGCASGTGGGSSTVEGGFGALTGESAVGQFLDAIQRKDYRLMSRLFGTATGPAEDRFGRVEVEQRMFVLAGLLQHRSYGLRALPVAEAEGKLRYVADMVGTRYGNVSVPFIAVSSRGRWFVEQVVTDVLTGG